MSDNTINANERDVLHHSNVTDQQMIEGAGGREIHDVQGTSDVGPSNQIIDVNQLNIKAETGEVFDQSAIELEPSTSNHLTTSSYDGHQPEMQTIQYVNEAGEVFLERTEERSYMENENEMTTDQVNDDSRIQLVSEAGAENIMSQEYDQGKVTELNSSQLLNLQQQGAFMVEDGMIVSSDNVIACSSDNQDQTRFQTININQGGIIQGQDNENFILVMTGENGETMERVVSASELAGTDMSVYDFKEDKNGIIQQEQIENQNIQHIQFAEKDESLRYANEDDLDDASRQFMCSYCSFVTNKRAILTQHQQQHEAERASAHVVQAQLMCNYCNYTSPKRYLLTRHMKTHSEDRPHTCQICDRGFKTMASLQNHVNTHTGYRPHKCKECSSAFTTSGELVRHVRYRHTYEKPHKCPECDYSSVELSKLKRHIRSHTGERPYQCPHCVYASPDTYKLKRHLRIHTGERPYECDICNARFTQSNSLKAHKLIHSGDKPVFQCELCPTTCGRKTDLKIHVMKLHTSDTPMQCKKCGKSFPDRYTYKIHTKTHEGEKCFKCELCHYAAMSQRHLESHILTHTGEKPYQCNECVQSFRQKQLLRRHKNLYHTPNYQPPTPKDKNHRCDECRKNFTSRSSLLKHILLHEPDNNEIKDQLEHISQMEQSNIEYTHQDANGGEYIKCINQQMMTSQEGEQVQVLMSKDGSMEEQSIFVQVMPQGYLPDDILEVTEIVDASGMLTSAVASTSSSSAAPAAAPDATSASGDTPTTPVGGVSDGGEGQLRMLEGGEQDAIHLLVAASERQQRLQEVGAVVAAASAEAGGSNERRQRLQQLDLQRGQQALQQQLIDRGDHQNLQIVEEQQVMDACPLEGQTEIYQGQVEMLQGQVELGQGQTIYHQGQPVEMIHDAGEIYQGHQPMELLQGQQHHLADQDGQQVVTIQGRSVDGVANSEVEIIHADNMQQVIGAEESGQSILHHQIIADQGIHMHAEVIDNQEPLGNANIIQNEEEPMDT